MARRATAPAGSSRRYRSPLREQQARRTGELILHAFADLVIERGLSGATMAAVAERAGVAERTVYRHFPNAQALLDGLSEQASAVLRERGADLADRSLDEAIEGAHDLYRGFEAAGPPIKAAIIAGLDAGYRSPGQPGRVDHLREALHAEFPDLTETEFTETVVLLRFQLGGWAWFLLTEREGLSTDQAARLSARAARAVVTDLRRRARAHGTPGGGTE